MISFIVMFLYYLGGQEMFKVYQTSGQTYWLMSIAIVVELFLYLIVASSVEGESR